MSTRDDPLARRLRRDADAVRPPAPPALPERVLAAVRWQHRSRRTPVAARRRLPWGLVAPAALLTLANVVLAALWMPHAWRADAAGPAPEPVAAVEPAPADLAGPAAQAEEPVPEAPVAAPAADLSRRERLLLLAEVDRLRADLDGLSRHLVEALPVRSVSPRMP